MDVSFQTRENYYTWLHKAADYFKSQGIRRRDDIGKDQIQAYADHLKAQGKTASTIHCYLAPVCKAVGISLKEIEKPLRHGSEFTRSGGGLAFGKTNSVICGAMIFKRKTASPMSSSGKEKAANTRSRKCSPSMFPR